MSALGHKRTFASQKVMSTFPPQSDIRRCERNVAWPQFKLDGVVGQPPGSIDGTNLENRGQKLSILFGNADLAAAHSISAEAGLSATCLVGYADGSTVCVPDASITVMPC
jgi:hypothetical protein